MAKNLFLYWGSGSIPCWKAMIALAEKDLQGYPNKLISFDRNEQRSEEILRLNPRGQVPTFRDGDIIVNESGAICDYVEYKYSNQGHQLLPGDAALRGKVLQRVQEAQNLFKVVIEDVVYYQFDTKPEDVDKEHLDKKKKQAREELERWEDYLKKEGQGSHVVGIDFTMADVAVFPSLAFGVRCQLNLGPFPYLQDYYSRLKDRPSIRATWPPHWEGTQGTVDYYQGL